MAFRCYFLNGDTIVSAMYAHVETEELAVRIATAALRDGRWSMLIDGLEVWRGTRRYCKILLKPDLLIDLVVVPPDGEIKTL